MVAVIAITDNQGITQYYRRRFSNLTWSNIQIASVVSDVFGKSAQEIIKSVLDDPSQMPDIETLVHKSMIKKVDHLKLSIEGEISDEQAEKMRVIKAHYDAVVLCKNNLENLIKELAREYQSQIERIQTVPGFKKEFTAIRLISEIGVDMTKFPTSGHLCSWAGVVPANNESAGKKHSTKISKGGRYLKPLLVQVANAVVRSEKHPEIQNKYFQLKKRRGHKRQLLRLPTVCLLQFITCF